MIIPMLVDIFNRKINYIRISVTDRCDLRCNYCMKEKMEFLPKSEILTLEQIERLSEIFISQGVEKIRLTGGEPLVRKNIMELINNLGKKIKKSNLKELTLTTNGTQLEKYAQGLKNAGVKRINISLDTLKKDKYHQITRGGDIDKVLNGINEALNCKLKVKLNVVALKNFNENELIDIVNWSSQKGMDITFIEVMPMGEIGEKRANQYMPLTDVKKLIQTKYSLTDDPLKTGGPARYVHCHETDQKIGFITPHTHNFCETCNRVRITCTGKMYMCLGQEDKVDLKEPLRKSENNDLLKETIYEAISRKPKGHDFVIDRKKEEKFVPRHMSVTGG